MSRLDEEYVKRFILAQLNEAKEAKVDRMRLNEDNFDMFQLKHDFSHKKEGQSTEVLSKQRMAVAQITSFFQQALTDLGDWFRVVAKDGTSGDAMPIRPEEIQKLTSHFLKLLNYFSHVGNSVQSALLGSLAISRVHGCMRAKPKFTVKAEGRGKSYKKTVVKTEDKAWELALDIIRQENYYPDPVDPNGYKIWNEFMDLSVLKQYAQGEYAIYDKAVVDEIPVHSGPAGSDLEEWRRSREAGQNQPVSSLRPRVKLTHFYGNIVDDETGDILMENCVCTLANDMYVIRKPTPNPFWHQGTDIVAAPLIEVANSVWHMALMDAPTQHNHSIIEMFNLVLDSAMQSVHGIKQLRTDVLADPKQADNGLQFGDTLLVTSALPMGAKALETVVTGQIDGQALNVLNILTQEFNASALTSDLRSGVTPFREQKATAVIEQSNTITSVFQGIAKNVESKKIQPELELAWQTVAQNWDLIDPEVFKSLFGAERGEALSQLAPQDVFVATVNGVKFDVFGITLTLGKAADFRKYTTMLQTIGTSEVLIEEFTKKYDFGKLLGQILVSLDIDANKIELDPAQVQNNMQGPPQPEQPQEDPMAQAGGAPGASPDMASQQPQAAGPQGGSFASAMGAPKFPGSPALAQNRQ